MIKLRMGIVCLFIVIASSGAWAGQRSAVATVHVDVAYEERIEDLAARVRFLEQTVDHLQRQCSAAAEAEVVVHAQPQDIWTCRVEAMGRIYYGEGITRGLAEMTAVERCKTSDTAFFCKVKSCSNE